MKKQIPNLLTAGNVICGCIAITEIAQENLFHGALLVLLAALFDVFDGLSARLLNVQSEIGGQLDSLADMISFGLVPSYLAYSILSNHDLPAVVQYLPFSMAAFSAYRLAKFNLDTRQSDSFIGVPTPANALLWISIPLMAWQQELSMGLFPIEGITQFMNQAWVILTLVGLMSILMVSELPLVALKFKSLAWKENQFRYLLIVFSLGLFSALLFAAIPFILILYLLLSLIENKKKQDEIQS